MASYKLRCLACGQPNIKDAATCLCGADMTPAPLPPIPSLPIPARVPASKSTWIHRLVTVFLLVVCLALFLRNRSLSTQLATSTDQLTTTRFNADISNLQFALACTPDQIDGDHSNWDQIDKVRLPMYVSANFPRTESYWEVLAFVLGKNSETPSPQQTKAGPEGDWTALAYLSQRSPDTAWAHIAGAACSDIAFHFRGHTPLGQYLSAHRDIFNTRIKPLLLRLLRAKTPYLAFSATVALDAAGDRSPEFHAALKKIVSGNFYRDFGNMGICNALDALGDTSSEFRDALCAIITLPYETADPAAPPPDQQLQAIALLKKRFPTTPVPATTPIIKP